MASFVGMSIQAVLDRKLRSALTIIMVIIGVALIIAVNGMSSGTVAYFNDQFSSLSPNMLIVNPGSQDLTELVIEDISILEGVKDVIPFIQNSVQISSNLEEKDTIILGVEMIKMQLAIPGFSIYSGSFVDNNDQFGIFLGKDLVNPESEAPFTDVGDTIKITYQKLVSPSTKPEIEKKAFSVRGIAQEIGMQGFLPFDDMGFISLRAAESIFDREKFDGLYVITSEEDGSLNREVELLIESTYEVSVFSPKQIADVVSNISNAIKDFVDNIALVSLGVAAVGIITTLYTSALERTKEIGTLKALGYTKRQILALFLNEALIIGVAGASIGAIIGLILGFIMNELVAAANITPIFELESIVMAWVLAIVLSALAGLYPAKKAADLDPVVALRKE